jgi:hypothetical protein
MCSLSTSRPAAGVELVPVNDEGILFDQNSQRLFHLNAVAARIWTHLTSERDVDDVAQAIAEAMCLEFSQARHFVLDMVKTWRGLGLLHDSRSYSPPSRESESVDGLSPTASDEELHVPIIARRRRYRFLDSVFSLGFSSPVLRALAEPIFLHLETRIETDDVLYLDVIETGNGIRVIHDKHVIGQCACKRGLAPLLHGVVGLLAIRKYRYLLAIHASGLVRSGSALVLAGSSGSGKSTLAAALLAAEWEYMSDDTVLLLPQTLDCVAAPYALTLKRGSWPILRPYFPAIDQVPIHHRADAQAVRYLCPGSHNFVKPRPVRWIGFSHHSTSGTSCMRRLEHIEGFYRLLQHCCAVPNFLTARDIQQLVQWSASIHFFEFAIASLDEAVAQIDAMTRGENEDDAGLLPLSDDSRKTASGYTSRCQSVR